MDYGLLKLSAGVISTIGLYSVLYKENKFYRFFEHIFLGLAVGWGFVALWTETLKETWWDAMVGSSAEAGAAATTAVAGHWAWVLLLPVGLMGYFVFSKNNAWLARIPIGIILGLWAGQQVDVWYRLYGPNINASLKPILPTTTSSFTKPDIAGLSPDQVATINAQVYPSQAITNIIFVFTILSVLSYFFFSFEAKNKVLKFMTTSGRWLLMIGFGAIFGSTVMMRFTLLIDRMYFVWIEFLKQGILHR
jgi:hypothetical protein